MVERLGSLLRAQPLSRFLDLGCGTGANVRYLRARVSGVQEWTVVDSDEAHLAEARMRMSQVETRCLDLARDLDSLPLEEGVIVTASALLDLVSEKWLRRLLARCCESNSIVLFALSYDGRIELSPHEPDDEWIRDQVNRHQRTDKGFGAALGPDATDFARSCLEELKYRVEVASSDWVLGAGEARLQGELMEGWAAAAAEMAAAEGAATSSDTRTRCRHWLAARRDHVTRGVSRVRVGHQDLLAWQA